MLRCSKTKLAIESQFFVETVILNYCYWRPVKKVLVSKKIRLDSNMVVGLVDKAMGKQPMNSSFVMDQFGCWSRCSVAVETKATLFARWSQSDWLHK